MNDVEKGHFSCRVYPVSCLTSDRHIHGLVRFLRSSLSLQHNNRVLGPSRRCFDWLSPEDRGDLGKQNGGPTEKDKKKYVQETVKLPVDRSAFTIFMRYPSEVPMFAIADSWLHRTQHSGHPKKSGRINGGERIQL